MPKLAKANRGWVSENISNSYINQARRSVHGNETGLTWPTERLDALTLTDSPQSERAGPAWPDASLGGSRQPGTEETNRYIYNPPPVDTSDTPSSPSPPPSTHPSHSLRNTSDVEQHSNYVPHHDIDELPSYEASVASSSVSGRGHFQDESYNSAARDWGDDFADVKLSGHRREKARVDASETAPSSRSSSPGEQQGELLPYLRDAFEETSEQQLRSEGYEHQTESMTMPKVIPQLPPDAVRRPTRPPPDPLDLINAAPPPPAIRSISEPSPPVLERPQLPPRGKTSPRFPGTTDLDKIDELDETTPHGYTLHHRGPYEFQDSTATPPTRSPVIRRDEQFSPRRQVLVEDTSFPQPPPPIPFKLNLKPGAVLTRLPPADNGQYTFYTPPQRAPLARIVPSVLSQRPFSPDQPAYDNMRPVLQDPANVYEGAQRLYPTNGMIMQYENYGYGPHRANSTEPIVQPRRANSRSAFPMSSANSSRSDFRSYPDVPVTSDFDYLSAEERRRFSSPVSILQERASLPNMQGSPQPIYPSSVSVCSSASTSQTRSDMGPPRPVELHRPKHLVMPAPLQQQVIDGLLPNPYSPNVFPTSMQSNLVDPTPAPKPSAATIPIRDPKKGNLLKKRLSKSVSPHENHHHLAPVRMAESNNNSVSSFGRGLEPEPELKNKRSVRKLSKRRSPN